MTSVNSVMGTLTMAISSLLSPFLLSKSPIRQGLGLSPGPSTVPGACPEWALDIRFDELKINLSLIFCVLTEGKVGIVLTSSENFSSLALPSLTSHFCSSLTKDLGPRLTAFFIFTPFLLISVFNTCEDNPVSLGNVAPPIDNRTINANSSFLY